MHDVLRIGGVTLAALLGAAGALTSVLLASGPGAPVNELVILLVVVAYAAVAVVIALARPGHPVGRLLLLGSSAWGTGEGLLALAVSAEGQGHPTLAGWLAVVGGLRGLGWLVLVLAVPLAFPDGRTPWGGHRPTILVWLSISVFMAALILAPTPLDNRLPGLVSPTGLPRSLQAIADSVALLGVALIATTLVVVVAGLVHRWRTGDELLRQQLLVFATAFAAPLLVIPLMPLSFVQPWMFGVVSLPVPIAIAVALLQRRLYDVQLVVNRTVTYVGLSFAVAALYAGTITGVGLLLHDRGAVWLPWAAAGVVAVAFAPLRDALQRGVNHLTYGQWSQPGDVLAATGRRLADAADVPALLHTLTAELGTGLGLAGIEVVDVHGRSLALYGDPHQVADELPLSAYGRQVGALRWGPASKRDADRRLMADLAAHLGGLVHSAGLLEDLRQAQERLVVAREEERRRLRRDLHDGLGPALAGLALQVDTVRNLAAGGNDTEEQLLELRNGVASTVVDVRRIVEGLRPPALDEFGLDGALASLAERITQGSDLTVEVTIPAGLPDISAAVEVAAYRVTQEALSNAVRHSGATRSQIALTVDADGIRLEVTDNGTGAVRPRPGGIGLTSMHERAVEIGGRLSIQAAAANGTTISLWLPRSNGVAP